MVPLCSTFLLVGACIGLFAGALYFGTGWKVILWVPSAVVGGAIGFAAPIFVGLVGETVYRIIRPTGPAEPPTPKSFAEFDSDRLDALEQRYGVAARLHSSDRAIPDVYPVNVVAFDQYTNGVLLITSGLTSPGSGQQANNRWAAYELALCLKTEERWGAEMLLHLAELTLTTPINPYSGIDIDRYVPPSATITTLVFVPFAGFTFADRNCGILLCLALTADETDFANKAGALQLLELLKTHQVYPFTELARSSVVGGAG